MNKKTRKIALYKEQDGRCWYCGVPIALRGAHLDHKIPRSKGGTDAEQNTVLACAKCNLLKGALSIDQFRELYAWNEIVPITWREVQELKRIVLIDGWRNLERPQTGRFFGEAAP